MNGVIAAGSPQTTNAGAQILRDGGNAVDAAVAAAFASFVTEAAYSSIGGGGFAMVQPLDADPVLVDFFCTYPALNRPVDELDFTSIPVDFAGYTTKYTVGRGSTAVPGNPAGLAYLLEQYGTLSLSDVLQPAIQLAREGYALSKGQAEVTQTLEQVMAYTPENAALFFKDGKIIGEGDTYQNPAFADTLGHIAQAGIADFYRGELASAIVDDQRKNGGLLTADDLAAYNVEVREPIKLNYRDFDVFLNPTPSAGGELIAFSLELLKKADFNGQFAHGSPEHVALLAEVMRQTDLMRDNASFDEATVASAWQAVQEALDSDKHTPPAKNSGSTTHISVIDEGGLAIALTTTPGATGGYLVGDTGMSMNNILGEDDLQANGFHNWTAAQVGQRIPSMMAPTLACHEDGQLIALGSAGSSRLRSAIVQVVSNLLDWRIPLSVAVNAPRVHFEGDLLHLEAGYREYAADILQMRYTLRRWDVKNLYFGGANAVHRSDTGVLMGAADIRRGGTVAIVE